MVAAYHILTKIYHLTLSISMYNASVERTPTNPNFWHIPHCSIVIPFKGPKLEFRNFLHNLIKQIQETHTWQQQIDIREREFEIISFLFLIFTDCKIYEIFLIFFTFWGIFCVLAEILLISHGTRGRRGAPWSHVHRITPQHPQEGSEFLNLR